MADPIPTNPRPRPDPPPPTFGSRFGARPPLPPTPAQQNNEEGENPPRPNPFGPRPTTPASNEPARPSPFGQSRTPAAEPAPARPSPFGSRPSTPPAPSTTTGTLSRPSFAPRPTPASEPAVTVEAAPRREIHLPLPHIHLEGRALSAVLLLIAFGLTAAVIYINPHVPTIFETNQDSASEPARELPAPPVYELSVPVDNTVADTSAADSEFAAVVIAPDVIPTESAPETEPLAVLEAPLWANAGLPTGIQAQVTIDVPLRLRAGPGVDYPQMSNPDSLMPTTVVDVVGQSADGAWLKVNVRLEDSQVRSAWLSAEFVTVSGDGIIPIVE